MKDEKQLSFHEINRDQSREDSTPSPIILLLDRLSDPSNIGALFRIADAANIEGIYGYKIHQDTKSKKIKNVSRQTNQKIQYDEIEKLEQVISLSESYYPMALEYTNMSVPFSKHEVFQPCMLIIGNEINGVSEELLELSQKSLHVPMLGKNSSMNVSVATGIVLYHLISS